MSSYKPLIIAALTLCATSLAQAPAAVASAIPDSITMNRGGRLFNPFSFDHAGHIELIKECADCHHHTTGTLVLDGNCIRCHQNSSPTAVVSCRGCHSSAPFSPETLAEKRADEKRFHKDTMGLKGALHQSCIGCHSKQGAGPVGCQDCHPRSKEGDAFYRSDRKGAKPAHAAKGH